MAILKYYKADQLTAKAPSFLFMGPSGVGKTTLLGDAADFLMAELGGEFLIMNFEPPDRVMVPKVMKSKATVLQEPSWAEYHQVMVSEYRQFKAGIAIDGLQWLARSCMMAVQGLPPNSDRTSVGQDWLPNQNTWHIWGERMRNHFDDRVSAVATRDGIPLMVTSLPKFDKDELSGEIFKSVNVWGKPSVDLPALFTVVAQCEYIMGATERWELNLRPQRGFPARDTWGKLGAKEPANFEHIWRKLMDGGTCNCQFCKPPATKSVASKPVVSVMPRIKEA